ncbi:hypothetical protein UPYG_G00062190 [Umbra pygmaea]|uniref:non-specific serine/threonine protein kinase n=1 Tax=Umbra pygmaea TaxID=75934 RepID=A0ABD0X9M6_UMBPY
MDFRFGPLGKHVLFTNQKLKMKRSVDDDADEGPSLKRSRQEAAVKATGDDQGTTSDLNSTKKRKMCFLDLDSDDIRSAKKVCVEVPQYRSTCSWRTPLAKLWEMFLNIPRCLCRLFYRNECFKSLYNVGKKLKKGGCGTVHKGTRKRDGKKVAVKFINKKDREEYLTFPGTSVMLPLEVALHLIVSRPPVSEHVVELLEWFDQPERIILVMEYPAPCMDMYAYMKSVVGGALTEDTARSVMRQVVLACQHCRDRGVAHRDIKGENLLVQTDTMKVKLIDFGCGDLLKNEPYKKFAGTCLYYPPECFQLGKYSSQTATIWSLGVLLFTLVNKKLPFRSVHHICHRPKLVFKSGVSKECKKLICWCLNRNARARPTLEEMLQNDWMTNGIHLEPQS